MSTVTTTSSSTNIFSQFTSTRTDEIENENGKLQKDDFLHLLITELQFQDPTSPMDSDKILSQTSQLATLESQTNTNQVMQEVAEKFSQNLNLSVVSAIGKNASLGTNEVAISSEDSSIAFDLHFENYVKEGTLNIYNSSGEIVKKLELSELEAGAHTFEWDGTNDDNERLDDGSYKVMATYSDGETGSYATQYGIYPIQSVKFEGNNAQLKIGNSYVNLDNIYEIF
jgi:flagellar basal-body rod modification protein FlgD